MDVREGAVALRIDTAGPGKGPGTHAGGTFYNPAMRMARDLTVLFVETRMHAAPRPHPFTVYDGLAASGVRGLRLAKEVVPPEGMALQVHMNDRDRAAVDRILAHASQNGVGDHLTVTAEDFALAPAGHRYDHVDVDPFGSPAPFLDAAIRALRPNATLALTATDTAALCGAAPRACRRRYDAVPWHGPGMHDVALRILAGAAVRHAARFDVALRPVLAHATDHYMRVYLEARRGAGRTDAALGSIGMLAVQDDGGRAFVAGRSGEAGPLWTGDLQDAALVAALTTRLAGRATMEERPLARFLERAADEAGAAGPTYEMGELAGAWKVPAPRMERLIERLTATGHRAARSHTAGDAFVTDAPGAALRAAFGGC